ncbi:MAG: response regulator [Candidatus Omnitrophota bacterium]
MTFKDNLKDLRRKMRLSQKELATQLHVAQSTVGMWESGKRTPKLDEIDRIAWALKITINRLIGPQQKNENKIEVTNGEIYIDGTKINTLDKTDVKEVLKHIESLQTAKDKPAQEKPPQKKTHPGKKVLIIDDEQGMCELLYSFLVPHNYRVFLSFNGQMGLEYFDELKPDVVLLDLCLPDINGLEILKIIRKISTVPVVVITAHPEDIADIHLEELHIDGYLEKPVALKQVLNTLKHIVGD